MIKTFTISILACCLSTMATAQNYSLNELRGWPHIEAEGDLDKDGVSDLVIIAHPDNGQNVASAGEDDAESASVPVLSIFKGQRGAAYGLWRQYKAALPPEPGETQSIDYSLEITDRFTLKISFSYFFSAGSWWTPSYTYVYRYQNGDFYLIGEDSKGYARNTGKAEEDSYNYLTHKKQHLEYNMFDEGVKPREKWSNIPRKPLKKLGSFQMGD